MAIPAGYDFILNGKGYLLARQEQLTEGALAWQVMAQGASIALRTPSEAQYGNQPASIEAPMVFRSAHLGYGDDIYSAEGRYSYAERVDARFPEQVIPGPEVALLQVDAAANVVDFFEWDSHVYALAGQYCYRIESGLDAVTLDKDFGAQAWAAAVYDEQVFVGMGYAVPFWRRNGSGWEQASGLYIGHVAAASDRLWASTNKNVVQCVAADPLLAGNWSPGYTVGDPSVDITALAEFGEVLYAGKTNGLFALDRTGYAPPLSPELLAAQHSDNCRGMKPWHGTLWVPHIRGLLNYLQLGTQGFEVRSVTPGQDAGLDNPVRGMVTAMAGDNRWLYVALYTSGGDTYVVAGRETTAAEQRLGRMIWHPIAYLPGRKCRAMHISGLWTNPRLLLALDNYLGVVVLPRAGDNPVQDRNCRFVTAGSITYPKHSWQTPATLKVWKSIEIESEDLSPNRAVDVYYRIDGGAWLRVGQATVSPRHVLRIPVAGGVSGYGIEIRLDFVLTAGTVPPIVRRVVVRGAERPSTVEVIQATVRCATGLRLRDGTTEFRSGATIMQELKRLAQHGPAVTLIDRLGTERWVLVNAPVEELVSAQEGEREPETLARITMTVFEATSTEETAYEPATYDEDSLYDDNYAYT